MNPASEDDFRFFLQQLTARLDRSYRDASKTIDTALARNNEALERNREAFDGVMKTLADQKDERRAMIAGWLELQDRIEAWGGDTRELAAIIRRMERRLGPGDSPA